MALPSRDWKIALGHNQAGSLTRWNTITDSGAFLLDPASPPPWAQYQQGVPRAREDLSISFDGFPGTVWTIPLMTVALYDDLYTTYQGNLVTIRDIVDGLAFANYNATFRLEERRNLAGRWELFAADPVESAGYKGEWGFVDVPIFMTGMEAL